jgi:integrase/recombinase XerD
MATMKKVQRKNGVSYQISFVHPITKIWTSKSVRCSYKDALKIKADIEKDIAFGRIGKKNPKQRKYYWSQLKKQYLDYSKRNKSPETVKREETVFKAFDTFIKKDLPISEIGRQKVECYKEKRLTQVSPATVSIDLRILKTTFNQAVKWELLNINPVHGVKIPKQDIVKVRFLTVDEIHDLIDVIKVDGNFDFLDLVISYINTGARRIELLYPQFTWLNVDFKERKILLKGKGDKKRFVPMNEALFEVLKRRYKNDLKHPFTFKPDFVSHKISKYYKMAKINCANLHSLRKTFGSLLIQNGKADLFTVSKLLGHSTLKTTEKYYVDLVHDNLRESVNGLDGII